LLVARCVWHGLSIRSRASDPEANMCSWHA
jgi:hypothetical protein